MTQSEFLKLWQAPLELLTLNLVEIIPLARAKSLRLNKAQLDELNRHGLAARVRIQSDDVYMLPRLAIVSALLEGLGTIQCIQEFTSLDKSTVNHSLEALVDGVTVQDDVVTIRPLNVAAVIFDWTDTLVDENALDDAICEFIPRGSKRVDALRADAEFVEILRKLEQDRSPLWYDYISLAARFGKTPEMLRTAHRRNKSKIRPLCNISQVLRVLKAHGIKTGLATNCHSKILEWRAELVNVRLHEFDVVVTSDISRDVTDKGNHLRLVCDRLSLNPNRCAFVSDDQMKDLLPAKAFGMTTIRVLAPVRTRSKYGTPPAPADPVIFGTTHEQIEGNITDYFALAADKVLRIVLPQKSSQFFQRSSVNDTKCP